MTTIAQQIALNNALVAPENQHGISKCNMRINPGMKPKEPTYQVVLDALALTTYYPAFLITVDVRVIYIHQEIKYITDASVDHLHQPWRAFATIINKCLSGKIDNKDSKKQDKMYYPRFTLLGTMRFVSRHKDTQVYGSLLPKAMTNQAMLDSNSYKTYCAIATGAEPSKPKKTQKKSDSTISSEETPSKKKPAKAKKDVPLTKKQATKPKPTKKKAPVKADKGKGLNVCSKVALSKVAQLKVATKRSKKDFHISHASGSGDGNDFELGVPNEQQRKISEDDDDDNNDDDDEDNTEDESDNDGNDDDGDNDDNDDDDSDDERTESNKDENPNLNQSNEEHKEEEEEYAKERFHTPKNHELIDEKYNAKEDNEEEKDDAEELYRWFEQVEEDAHNASPSDNEITSLMDTIVRHEEPSSQTSSVFTVPVMVIPEFASSFTTTIPPPPPSFNPLLQQATPTPTPIAFEVTTSFPALLDFLFVFKFNNKVTNLEKIFSDFATPVIEQNATESLEVVVLAKSSSQPKSTYAAAASLSEYKLTEILMDKMEEHKSYLRADYKRELYDALSKDDKDKDQDPYVGSNRGTKRKKESKEAESSRDPRSKESGSLSRKYTTSVTKTKAATYEVQWIEDMIPSLWSPIKTYSHSKAVEDLQLGVESYQKKLNLTKPDTFRPDLRKRTTFTAYSDP
nr:hypothetical protein [Tanacetum cinerariifolium]